MTFETPSAFLLLIVFPFWLLWRSGRGGFRYSRGEVAARAGRAYTRWLAGLPGLLRGLAVIALTIALARPQTGVATEEVEAEGIAIALVMDISSSMLALDMQPLDRLEVAKRTVLEFVRAREYDRIALIAFAGEALTQVPLTIDYGILERSINNLRVDLLEDGTAIGTALATAANRLRRTPGTSKVGGPCANDSDCAEPPNAECFTTVGGGMFPTIVFPGGYCSKACGHEDSGTPDCGAEGGCAQLSMSGSGGGSVKMSFCAKGCKKNEDCRVSEGYTCRIIIPGFPGFCAPP